MSEEMKSTEVSNPQPYASGVLEGFTPDKEEPKTEETTGTVQVDPFTGEPATASVAEDSHIDDEDAGEPIQNVQSQTGSIKVDTETFSSTTLEEIEQEKVEFVSEEDSTEDNTPYTPGKQHSVQNYPTSLPENKGATETIELPPAVLASIRKQISKIPNLDVTISDQQQKWVDTLTRSTHILPMEDPYTARLEEDEARFKQEINHNGKSLKGIAPSYKRKEGEYVVEGERAILQLLTHLGVGGLFRAPLWASGLWVTFKPATESELLELNRIITADKIQAGRWSYGLSLSSNVVYTADRVFEFALNHVYNTSVKQDELPIYKLREYIAPQDIYSFIWGFLCACYPSGFNYETACINSPGKCTHVFKETLNLTKLQWTDESALTEWQKTHMSQVSANSMTLDSIKRYREEMKNMQPKRIVLNQGTKGEVAFTIKTPSVMDYINQGHRWISSMVESVNTVLGMDASDELRNNTINRLNKATTLCQYSHWFETVEFGDLSTNTETEGISRAKIEDAPTVEETLKALSAIDSIRESIISEVLQYIAKSTVSVIGIPAYDCPVCSTPQQVSKDFPRHTNIIPLDMLQVFFELLLRRLSRVENR